MTNIIKMPERETDKYALANNLIGPTARKLIESMSEIAHLEGVSICYMLAKNTITRNGKQVLGRAAKASDQQYLLHGYRFTVTVDAETWHKLPEKREPLLFHELLHCAVDVDDEGVTRHSIRPHDLEEFGAVVERFGLWDRDLKQFARQMELPLRKGAEG